jgi:hypothetical protein
LCIVFSFTKCCSTTSSSSDSSMNTGSTNVAPSHIYYFACQLFLLLHNRCANYIYIYIYIYIYHELSFVQILFSHCTFFPSAHFKDDDEWDGDLQPTTKYSTHLHVLIVSTPLLFLFFSTILLPPPTFVYAHSYVLPFPLFFFVVSQLHSLHSWCCELQNFKNTHNF